MPRVGYSSSVQEMWKLFSQKYFRRIPWERFTRSTEPNLYSALRTLAYCNSYSTLVTTFV
jgi:hypothetical protein